jgi:predicted PurR-regulated permease PerM
MMVASRPSAEREHPAPAHEAQSARERSSAPIEASVFSLSAMRTMLVALAAGAGLFLAWTAAGTLFLLFAGLLFAALLDACTRGLAKLLPIGRGCNLAIVSLILTIAIAGLLVWSGLSIALQIDQLVHALDQQLHSLARGMAALGLAPASDNGGPTSVSDFVRFLFPNPNQLFGEAQSAFSRAVGGLGDAVIVVLIGLFVAADPATYRRSAVEFLPPRRRQQVGSILDDTALFLQRWLIGQLAAMLLLAILTSVMLMVMGVPSPIVLGILAGLLEFIPYLGAVAGAVPILLLALPLGNSTLLVTMGLYVVIHVVVGNVVMPMIQKRTVDLPPAFALASLTLFGVLFGIAGITVATPIVAAIRHALLRLQHYSVDDAAA